MLWTTACGTERTSPSSFISFIRLLLLHSAIRLESNLAPTVKRETPLIPSYHILFYPFHLKAAISCQSPDMESCSKIVKIYLLGDKITQEPTKTARIPMADQRRRIEHHEIKAQMYWRERWWQEFFVFVILCNKRILRKANLKKILHRKRNLTYMSGCVSILTKYISFNTLLRQSPVAGVDPVDFWTTLISDSRISKFALARSAISTILLK